MSIDIGTNNASRVVGPTVGGLLLATVGLSGAFILGAVSYLIALIVAFTIRYRDEVVRHESGGMIARVMEGVRLAQSDERLRGTLIITLIFNMFGWPFSSMIPVIGHDNLHLGPVGVGVLASMEGVGAFCGAVVIALLAVPSQYARIYIGGVLIYMTALTLFALAPHPALAGAALAATGIGGAAFAIMQTTFIYLTVPPVMRGRMFGVLTACIGIGPLGFIHVGVMAELIGAQWATVTTGLEGFICMLLTRRYWRIMGA
jgi:predicted MFS family arabinose efflux permease